MTGDGELSARRSSSEMSWRASAMLLGNLQGDTQDAAQHRQTLLPLHTVQGQVRQVTCNHLLLLLPTHSLPHPLA
jgi:hypothetical protein